MNTILGDANLNELFTLIELYCEVRFMQKHVHVVKTKQKGICL